ncbi:MAG TPA: hypothetical protein VFA32_17150, partial [Dehalococcoidia bacterium]|nr:hypothetical protein [Dehalococcoidia bacterium]
IIILHLIFSNTVNTLMVVTSLLNGQVILLEASLSFRGWSYPRRSSLGYYSVRGEERNPGRVVALPLSVSGYNYRCLSF